LRNINQKNRGGGVLAGFFKRHGWKYIPGVVFLLFNAYLQNLTPTYLGRIIDALGDLSAKDEIIRLLFILMLVSVVAFGARFTWRYFLNGNARNMEAYLRDSLFTHLQKMGAGFYNYRKTGDLMAYGINDINAIRMSFGPALAMAVNSAALTGIAVANMASGVDARLAAFVLVPAPFIIVLMLFMGKHVRARFRRVQEAFAAISGRVQENITGLRVIKAYVQEAAEVSRFEELNKNSRDANLKMIRVSASMTPAVDLFFGISFAIGLIYGGSLVRQGAISLGGFVAFNGYLALIVQPVRMVSRVVGVFSRGSASYRRFDEIMRAPVEIADGPDDAPENLNRADVEVKNLSFKYEFAEENALTDISFRIAPGKKLGILGRTGSGKTTLANLLARVYNVPDGTVFFGGADANGLGLDRLRGPIGYAPQDNFLFSASVEDNIKFFDASVSEEKIKNAARAAAVLENILEFPEGFKTQVGERGMSLSGGQKQRICIARALAREPALLILDDSLSSVDMNTEASILKNLNEVTSRGGSVILIAHRVSALQTCDEIVVLDGGRIKERGSHNELLSQNGIYAAVARGQSAEEDDANE